MKRATLLSSLLIGLSLVLASAAAAQNQAFLSTSLESSDAWYSLQFTAGVAGSLDKIRVTFPLGTVGGNVGLGDLSVAGTATKAAITIDAGNPDQVLVDLTAAKTVTTGTKIVLEVVGLTNPGAGSYQVGVELLDGTGVVIHTLAPIPFSIAAAVAGDITGVTAGTGLIGGGLSGNVTLSVNAAQVQTRVSGTCAAGNAVRVVNQNGTVTCQAVTGSGGGTVTSVGTGTGLTGGPITTTGTVSVAAGGVTTALLAAGAVTGPKLAANSVDSSKIVDGSIGAVDVNTTQIQARVTGTCMAGNAIRAVDAVGGVTCEATGGGGGAGGWTDGGTVVSLTTGTDNVGVGTVGPASKFHVVSGAGATLPPRVQSSATTGFSAGWDFYLGATGKGYVGVPDGGAAFGSGELIVFGGTGTKTSLWAGRNRALTLDTSGNVGLGTTTPTSKLEIAGAQDGLAVTGFQPFITLRDANAGGARSLIQGANGNIGLVPNSFIGTGTSAVFIQNGTGNVGIGTIPTSRLEIAGQDGMKIRGFQPFVTLQDDNAAGKQGFVQSVDGGVALLTNSRRQLVLRDSDGLVSVRALQIVGGADLSENFDVRGSELLSAGHSPGDVPPGTLVAIDPKHPGKLIVSGQAYDRRVAGIVSGAGGVRPGMVLGQEGTLADGKHPVALSGRVYCWVDASHGPVEPGDLLTTSDTPGHAMKVTDHAKAQGAIVGKAMTSLATGRGLVLVLVTLQ